MLSFSSGPQYWCGAPLLHLLCHLCWVFQVLDKVCSSAVKALPFPAGPPHYPHWSWSETGSQFFLVRPHFISRSSSKLPACLKCGNSSPNNRHNSYNCIRLTSFNKSLFISPTVMYATFWSNSNKLLNCSIYPLSWYIQCNIWHTFEDGCWSPS